MSRKLLDMDYKVCYYPKAGEFAGKRHEIHQYEDESYKAGVSKDKEVGFPSEEKLRRALALNERLKVRVSCAIMRSSPSLVSQQSLVFEKRC